LERRVRSVPLFLRRVIVIFGHGSHSLNTL
jgi:hypothetical protein